MPDFLINLIYAGGLIGISLGAFTYVRPFLRNFRGLFPNAAEHEYDVRKMKDALSGVYRGSRDDELETFRSFFSQNSDIEKPSMYSRSIAAAPRRNDPAEDEDDIEEEEPPTRPPIRTFAVNSQDAPPRVVPLLAVEQVPDDIAGTEALPEEEDLLADLPDPLVDTGEGVDEDLLSLFEETEEFHTVPDAVRKAIPDVTIDALVAEARQVWSLLGPNREAAEDAA